MGHRTVLVAATPADAGHDALALGIDLARPLGGELVVGGVVTGHGKTSDARADALREELETLRATAPHDVPSSVEVVIATSVLRGLNDLAEELEPEVLVLGPSHRGVLGRALRGNVAAGAAFAACCAVAVAVPGQALRSATRVGVGWDATAAADEALEWAVQMAERTGGVVRIIRALEPRHREGTVPEGGARERTELVRRAAEARAAAESDLLWGDAADALIEASRNLDLLVVGSSAKGPVRRALLGSVTGDVLHHAHCPLVVLPRGVHAPMDTAAA